MILVIQHVSALRARPGMIFSLRMDSSAGVSSLSAESEGPAFRAASASDDGELTKRERERSRIEFPYTDLEAACDLVETLQQRGGGSSEIVQLAGWMDQTPTGGTFRTRLSAARIFGLIETLAGDVSITPLGREILSGDKVRARIEAFLRAPLYREMFDRLKGYPLPPVAAIEQQMGMLGVPHKQRERARQTFTKSASYTGLVDPITGRLVKPSGGVSRPESVTSSPSVQVDARNGPDGDQRDFSSQHPLIAGLFLSLPAKGDRWTLEEAADWLQAAASNFRLAFKLKGQITVTATRPNSPDPDTG